MTNIEIVKERLHKTGASLVVMFKTGEIKEFYNRRVIDIVSILKENPKALQEAVVADKVIGKVASSLLTMAGVKEIYGAVMSKFGIVVLKDNNINYEYGELVDYVINNEKNGMCPMENKFKDEKDLNTIYSFFVK